MSSIRLWVGNFGDYVIPEKFWDVPLTKSGWPDKRYKRYEEFIAWVKSVDVQN